MKLLVCCGKRVKCPHPPQHHRLHYYSWTDDENNEPPVACPERREGVRGGFEETSLVMMPTAAGVRSRGLKIKINK